MRLMDCGGGDDDDLFFFVFFASANKIEQQDYSNEKVVQNDQMVFFSFEIFLHQEVRSKITTCYIKNSIFHPSSIP